MATFAIAHSNPAYRASAWGTVVHDQLAEADTVRQAEFSRECDDSVCKALFVGPKGRHAAPGQSFLDMLEKVSCCFRG